MSDRNKKHNCQYDKVSMGISAQDVTVTYRNGHTALWNSSFEIPRGTITVSYTHLTLPTTD